MSFRFSRQSCCVPNCHNSYNNTNRCIKFYNFPSCENKQHIRDLWIHNIRQYTDVPNTWLPRKTSTLCSAHFVGNAKSGNPQHAAFAPTIFNNTGPNPKKSKLYISSTDSDEETALHKQNQSCQTDPAVFEDETFCFTCTLNTELKTVSTQANIIPLSTGEDINTKKTVFFNGYASISNDESLNSIAGVDFKRFCFLIRLLEDNFCSKRKLSLENYLLIFLIKIKTGLSYLAIATFFNIHRTTVSRVFTKILYILLEKTRQFVFWPSREVVQSTLPEAFKKHHQNCRVIIDCTEIRIEQPEKIDMRIYTYSHYKNTYTFKFLVGITPNGLISFISKCYGGKSSDAFITNDSKILDLLEPGDEILADKGFPGIKTRFGTKNVIVVMPPFVHDGRLDEDEVLETHDIASVRIHIERSIQRIKIYNILNVKFPTELLEHSDAIVHICCVLANLQPPIFKDSSC